MCQVTPRELIEQVAAEYLAEIAAEEAARRAAAPPRAERPRGTGPHADNRVARCRAYLKTLPPSVEGQNGSDRVFHAARVIWNDFGVDEADGYALLDEYNATCSPPWEEDGKQGLRRKWNEAVDRGPCPKGRGWKLQEDRPGWNAPSESRSRTRSEQPAGSGRGVPPPAGDGDGHGSTLNDLPDIVHNGRQYRDVESDALQALVRANDPPSVFVGNGCGLVDLQKSDPDSSLMARELDTYSLRGVLARVANWISRKETSQGVTYKDDFPPLPLLTSFPARGAWPGIPHLRSVATYPVFGPKWELAATSGYHPSSLIYCDLGSLALPSVPVRPSVEEVEAARELIVTELLGDFPFVDQSSRANAVAMLILPLIRHAIDGPTPLALIDAPAEGTGKSLLAEVVTLTTIGEIPQAMSPDLSDEEWNKLLLAELIAGSPVVYFDNANKTVDSGNLAAALTSKYKRGRILGSSTVARARVNVCWLLTGNNVLVSREIARRVYWIRLDRGEENPSEHVGYRHPDIHQWIRDNRERLLAALITLVNNWLTQGRPPGSETLGKFEHWSRTVGGILAAAGIDGLLGNAEEFRQLSANEANEMPEFVRAWWERHHSLPVMASELFTDAKEILESVLTAENDDGRKKQLGRFLRKQRDRVCAGYRIVAVTRQDGKEDRDHSGRPRYKLQEVKASKKPEAKPRNEYAESDEEFDITA